MRGWGVTSRIEMLEAAADVVPVSRSEARARLGLADGTPVLLDVGRLAPEKRHDVVLRYTAPGLWPGLVASVLSALVAAVSRVEI
jgi:hypothetical protein